MLIYFIFIIIIRVLTVRSRMYIYIYLDGILFTRLVWGSLRLTPITIIQCEHTHTHFMCRHELKQQNGRLQTSKVNLLNYIGEPEDEDQQWTEDVPLPTNTTITTMRKAAKFKVKFQRVKCRYRCLVYPAILIPLYQ